MFLAASTAPLVMFFELPQTGGFENAAIASIQRYLELIRGSWALAALNFLLEPELTLLEGLDHRMVRHGPVHLTLNLPFDTGVLELKGADVRTIHGWFSSLKSASLAELPTGDSKYPGMRHD